MKNIAIIGCGQLSLALLELKKIPKFDFYTSHGNGELMGERASPLSILSECDYDEIYIAVGKYEEILAQLSNINGSQTKYFWMDLFCKKIRVINNADGDMDEMIEEDGLVVLYDMNMKRSMM